MHLYYMYNNLYLIILGNIRKNCWRFEGIYLLIVNNKASVFKEESNYTEILCKLLCRFYTP